jgi:hypothetical protein
MPFLATFLGLVGAAAGAVLLVILIILAFELWMFISALQNRSISNEIRLLWLIGMLLLHPFVAIAYYFTDHKKTKEK